MRRGLDAFRREGGRSGRLRCGIWGIPSRYLDLWAALSRRGRVLCLLYTYHQARDL